MIKKILSFALCCLLVTTASSAFVTAQTKTDTDDSTVSKIKAKIIKRGTGENKRVKVIMTNGTKVGGYLSRTGEDSFDLTDSKTRQTTSIAYSDVAQIKNGGLSKGAKIGIIVGIAGGIAAVVIGIFLKRYCNEQAC